VSLCGDAAADPRLTALLLRSGLRALSVAPGAIGAVKQAVAAVDLSPAAP
jgi:phosphotransferase system enzyme I (PtsI)